MFKNLLGFGKGKDFLTEVISEFSDMLNNTHTIYVDSYNNLFDENPDPGLSDRIYEIDRSVNAAQRSIRKRSTCSATL